MSEPDVTVAEAIQAAKERLLREEFLKANAALYRCYEVAREHLTYQKETDGVFVNVSTTGQGYKVTIKVEIE